MKKLFFCSAFITLLLVIVILSACGKQKNHSLNLPEKTDIIDVSYIAENESKVMVDDKKIDRLLLELSSINKKYLNSYQDTPQVSNYAKISFRLPIGMSSDIIYIYRSDNEFFIEQPYNCIFLIDKNQYNTITGFFN
ncbi:MAG: DUF5301 domain-containing protein [Oscillospiraceae bacterium]|nr:DUF5301 domain-containing protein [Oscillospiraceae bacterium]